MIEEKFNLNLINKHLTNSKIAIAVSGGLDSMVLLDLTRKIINNAELHILTLDHNLRKNSSKDAEFVCNYSNSLGLKYHMFKWDHGGVHSNIQSKARETRYNIFTNYCKQHNIPLLLTAHHADDQIENFFIKLSRGSSIYSLANNTEGEYNGVKIIRPLSNIFKKEIEIYAQSNNINFVEDESNIDTKYLRNEIRQKLKSFFGNSKHLTETLFKQRILLSIENITRATKSIENLVEECITKSFELTDQGALLNLDTYLEFMPEEQMQSLCKILQHISGINSNIRMHSISRLHNTIITQNLFTLTLHGCIIKKSKSGITISQEKRISR